MTQFRVVGNNPKPFFCAPKKIKFLYMLAEKNIKSF